MTSGLSIVSLLSIILARWIINVSLSVVLGYQLVYLFLTWQVSFPTTAVSHSPPTAPPAALKLIDISPITTAHLFGTMPAVVESSVINTPETKLNLKLRGIYYSSDPQKSFAVIAETEGKHQLYRQGATVSSQVTLQEIHPKAVILNRNGRYETLKLTRSDNSSQATVQTATTNKTAVDENRTPGQLLNTYQQQLRENPQKLLSLVRLEPVEREGKFGGFRLSPGRDTTLFTRFNLKTGDVLVAVNGIDLDSPLKGLSLIEQLGQTNQLNLAILRNGQPVSLSFSVDK
jgi:general secretion pathway protein C